MKKPYEPLLFFPPAIQAGKMQIDTIKHLMSGDATYSALQDAINRILDIASKDHDVVIEAFGIFVTDVRFHSPHTFIFNGLNEKNEKTSVVVHYSQIIARIAYKPKSGAKRIITGFSPICPPSKNQV